MKGGESHGRDMATGHRDLASVIQAPEMTLNAHLDTFERVAISSGWDRRIWALQLVPYLAGETHIGDTILEDKQVQGYEVAKVAILDWMGLSKYQQVPRCKMD